MKKEEKMREQRIPVSILMALFLLALVLLTVQVLSRYVNGGSGGSEAQVARFQVTSDLTEFQKQLSVELRPGMEESYSFEVLNESEVMAKLVMSLSCEGNLPLQILYKSGTQAEQVLSENILTIGNPEWTDRLNAEDKKKTYTLTVRWPKDRNDSMYAGGVSTVELKIKVEQID